MKRLFGPLLVVCGTLSISPGQVVHSAKLQFPGPKENLGVVINTPYTETKPVISGDGKTLYFCRQNYPGNIRGKQDDQDIYYSQLEADRWTPAKNIGWPLNDQHPNGVSSVSPDGNSLLLINEYIKGGYVKKGVSISNLTKNGWNYPSRVDIEDFYNFSPYVDYAMAANGKVLFMSVQRREGYGDQDIYVSLLQSGTWGIPINLGAVINTAGADFAPFLAADGKTLYFASEGHPGFGGSDIFLSKRLDDSWQNWSRPINLGSAVNSSTWDAYYSMSAQGNYAYFVSKNPETNSRDIYHIALPEEVQPEPVVMIRGQVLNGNTKEPLEASVVFETYQNGEEQGLARSDPNNGSYKIVLPHGDKYRFLAKVEGYISIHKLVDLTTGRKYGELQEDLYLIPLVRGEKIPITNIFFVRSRAELMEESYADLDRLAQVLHQYPSLEIELGGHTDNIGDPELNLDLSLQRVAMVKEYLVNQGINPQRLKTRGYGDTQPIASNQGELNRRLNRRVEFTILNL